MKLLSIALIVISTLASLLLGAKTLKTEGLKIKLIVKEAEKK